MNASPSEKFRKEQSARFRMHIPEWLCLGQWLPWLVLVVGLIVTCLLWRHEQQIASRELKANFEFRARRDIMQIEQRRMAYEQVMRGVQGLFAASRAVNRTQFRDYVAALQLETNYPGIQGVSFALNVPLAQKAAHTAAIRAEGFPGYSISPEGRRENYVPVIYLEPFSDSNRRVFGYDTYSEPVRRTAMDRARDTGKAALSGKIRLVQEAGKRDQAGVLMFMPVYKYGLPHDTLASRRSGIIGWIAASFRMDDLMAVLHAERDNETDIEVYDGTEVSDKTLLYDSDDIRFAGSQDAPLHFLTNLEIAGHTWTVAIRSLPDFETRLDSKKPRIIAIAGTVLSLLLTLLTSQLAAGRSRALAAAREMNRELIESEKRYRIVADFASNWEYWRATDGSFRYVSPSCVQICGYSREEFYHDPSLMMRIIHPEDAPLFNRHINDHNNAVSKNHGPEPIEIRIITRDGQQRWIAHVCRPVFDDDGTPLGRRANNRDITERKRAEMALHEQAALLEAEMFERRQAQEALSVKQLQLEGLNRSLESRIAETISELRRNDQLMIQQSRQAAMGEMIHNIAHQWRQPLNSLGLLIQGMRSEYDAGLMTPERMASDTEDGMELIAFMSQTVDDFRRFFHEDKENVCFSVQESIRRAITLVSATLKDHGIALIVEQGVDVQINGHPNEYAQALLNLLSNAKDVLLERGVAHPVITIKVSRQGEQAVLTIGDNAGGIPDDVIGRVFDHYFTTKAEGKGTGIGLYMSKTIIEKHMGGSLTVTNVGDGAEFRVEVEAVQLGSQQS